MLTNIPFVVENIAKTVNTSIRCFFHYVTILILQRELFLSAFVFSTQPFSIYTDVANKAISYANAPN